METQVLTSSDNFDLESIFNANDQEVDISKSLGQHYRKDKYIYMPEQLSDKIYFISSGRVKLGTYGRHGQEVTKAILGKGDIFGELSIVGEIVRRDFAYTMEGTHCYEISVKKMLRMIQLNKSLRTYFMNNFGTRIMDIEHRLNTIVLKNSRSRIIQFLIDLTEKKGQRVGYEWVVRKFMTHKEVGDLSATSRQTVTMILNELRKKDLIKFDRKRLLVRNLDLLREEVY